jgi:hypothetical protein
MTTDKPVNDWNVRDFTNYLAERHEQLFGVPYVPYRSWKVEQGLIGSIIGTRGKNAKPRKHEPAVLKRFIDECFREYRPTRQYPGISFGFMWTYKKATWQRVLAELKREETVKQATDDRDKWNELADWI